MIEKGFIIGDRGLSLAGDTHPDWMIGYADLGLYRIIGASAVGKLHLQRQRPRDDAFVIRTRGPWLAIGVSDGLGSHDLSRFGATQAAHAITSYLLRGMNSTELDSEKMSDTRRQFPIELDEISTEPNKESTRKNIKNFLRLNTKLKGEKLLTLNNSPLQSGSVGYWARNPVDQASEDHMAELCSSTEEESRLLAVMKQAFTETNAWLQRQANELDVEVKEIGCTALGFLLNLQTGWLCVGQVGDGAILGLTDKGQVTELVQTEESEELTRVAPITSYGWEKHFSAKAYDPVKQSSSWQAYLVMTDGISVDYLYQPDMELLERWAATIRSNALLETNASKASLDLLNWVATYEVDGSFDDRTLVVVAKR